MYVVRALRPPSASKLLVQGEEKMKQNCPLPWAILQLDSLAQSMKVVHCTFCQSLNIASQ